MSDKELPAKIRTYPKDHETLDIPNTILHDLRCTWKHRAVAKKWNGEHVEWYAHHPEYNRVLEWWPNFYDEPVWSGYSIYAFSNREGNYTFELYEWPEFLDENAEVQL